MKPLYRICRGITSAGPGRTLACFGRKMQKKSDSFPETGRATEESATPLCVGVGRGGA